MQVGKTIHAPAEAVWQTLIDTRLWPVWGPSIVAVECPQRWISEGVEGRVKTALHLWVPFRISCFSEPLYWHWHVAGIPATGHRVRPLGVASCELIFEIPYNAFFYRPICRRALNNISRITLEQSSR